MNNTKVRRALAFISGLALCALLGVSLVSGSTKDPKHGHKLKKAPQEAPRVPTGPQPELAQRPARVEHAAAPAAEVDPIVMKVLVISADGGEADLPAIKQSLAYLGVPYEVYIAAQTPGGLVQEKLFVGIDAYYQAVILTTADLGYFDGTGYVSALSQSEWNNLSVFEATFGIRRVSWYAWPSASLGFAGDISAVDTTTSPLTVQYSTLGKTIFSYANTTAGLTIKNAYTYLAQPATDGATTPLLTDPAGHALAIHRRHPDGREHIVLTFDSNPYLTHSLVLGYGLVRWVTKGLFVGERHAYLSMQVDDLYLSSDIYPETGATYRMDANDVSRLVGWQSGVQAQPLTHEFKFDMAFNGYGTTTQFFNDEGITNDTLVAAVRTNQARFKFISHTYDHTNMDAMSYTDAAWQITQNNSVANNQRFSWYDRKNLVTPQVSGLLNRDCLQALYDRGVRHVVSDTSQPGYNNPSPNAAIVNPLVPGILMLPRRPTNLYYNVSTPAEWVAEYNSFYRSYWGRDLTYAEVLDKESEMILPWLLRGDADPYMFHQANLRAYDGTRSCLGDLIDATVAKYAQLSTVPFRSPPMSDLASVYRRRMSLDASGVVAKIVPRTGTTPGSVTLAATRAGWVPLVGLNTGNSYTTVVETYAGDTISYVYLYANQPVTFSLANSPAAAW